jgi:hypothetical protein
MFEHVYAELPPHLKAQREQLAGTLGNGHAPAEDADGQASPPMRGQRTTRR